LPGIFDGTRRVDRTLEEQEIEADESDDDLQGRRLVQSALPPGSALTVPRGPADTGLRRRPGVALLIQSALVLAVGAVFGLGGQVLATRWTSLTTGFPSTFSPAFVLAGLTFAGVALLALVAVSAPGYAAARVSPRDELPERLSPASVSPGRPAARADRAPSGEAAAPCSHPRRLREMLWHARPARAANTT
jgi:hypothetical protein